MSNKLPVRDSFSSKFGVIAAAAGSAVGLGNIWRFPYVAGENGGGAFLLIYIIFISVIGVSVMLSEFAIGRKAQRNVFGSFKKLAPGKPWFLVGFMGVVAAFVILSFYSAVAGWTLEYTYNSLMNSFQGKNPAEIESMFDNFRANSWRPAMWLLLFMIVTALIVWAGVKNGIERYARVLMPVLFLLIIILGIRSITLDGAMEGLKFLFKPDFSKLSTNSILEALGQAFFSLSIGMGALITYGSYISKKENLSLSAIQVTFTDAVVAILAGIAIFPAVFAFGIEPGSGPGLVFVTLPNIFIQMPGGYFFAVLFFTLLIVAALTSSISVLEVVVAYFSEEFNISRSKATVLGSVTITALGLVCAMSWGATKTWTIFGLTTFECMDWLSANLLLPLGGFFIVIFVGWVLGAEKMKDEISNQGQLNVRLFAFYDFIVKFIAPIAIAIVFMDSIGLLNL
ncbi:MAG: sodium-dependent transporter [Bacteroidales bacterium]